MRAQESYFADLIGFSEEVDLLPLAEKVLAATELSNNLSALELAEFTHQAALTDLERAARFLYLQRTAFGGKVSGRNFGVDKTRPARFNLTTLEPMLEDLHSRLSGVVIECLDWSAFIPRYDGPETLFYLDPPYWGCEDDYGKAMFARSDFTRLANQLASIRGKFLLSLNDVPDVRSTFAAFHLAEVRTTYTISGKRNDPAGTRPELLISNWPLPGC